MSVNRQTDEQIDRWSLFTISVFNRYVRFGFVSTLLSSYRDSIDSSSKNKISFLDIDLYFLDINQLITNACVLSLIARLSVDCIVRIKIVFIFSFKLFSLVHSVPLATRRINYIWSLYMILALFSIASNINRMLAYT